MYLLLAVFLPLILYYFFAAIKATELYVKKESGGVYDIISSCSHVKEYRPTPFLLDTHSQTIFGRLMRRAPTVLYEREILTMQDGADLAIDWDEETLNSTPKTTPVVILIHGLVGSSNSNYMRILATHIKRKTNWKVVAVNARGCGTALLKTPKMYHAGLTSDIREVINHVKNKFPEVPLFSIAFSLGANMLTKYLGEEGSQAPLTAVATVSNPFDFVAAYENCNISLEARVYNWILAKTLVGYVKRNGSVLGQILDLSHVSKAKKIFDFDERVIIPMWGYKTVMEYYERNSSKHFIKNIAIPTLFVNSADDPVIPKRIVPVELAQENPNVCFAVTSRGGHVAFLQGLRYWNATWGDHVCVEFLEAALKKAKKKI